MEVHPWNNLIMTQFIARVQTINLFHIILYHVTIGFNEIILLNMSYASLCEIMNYYNTQTYFKNAIIPFGINYGI